MSLSKIVRDMQAQISKSVYVETDNSGCHRIATPFAFGDGDRPVIVLVPNGEGWMLSDSGSTLFRLGFQMDDDALADPANKRRLNSALSMAGISRRDDELTKPLLNSDYAGALFDFVHALLKIDELGDFGAPVSNPTVATPMSNSMHPRTPDVFDYLKQCVTQRRTTTYGEIGQNVGLAAQGTAKPLYYIRDKCLERKLPPITAIVFNKSTGLPGKGLKPDGTQVTPAEWKDMLGQVFATDWSNVDLVNDR